VEPKVSERLQTDIAFLKVDVQTAYVIGDFPLCGREIAVAIEIFRDWPVP
jgi:hypothetical protein